MSDTYGYACYNYFDNTTLSKTVSGATTTSSTAGVYAPTFSPDPDNASNNTSVVISSAAANNLSLTVASSRCLQSTYQAVPKSVAFDNINSSDASTYAYLPNNDWEWSMLYKCNLTGTTRPTSANTQNPIGAGVNSWRYWLLASTATIATTTAGFFVTQDNDGYIRVYAQSGGGTAGTTAAILASTSALTNGTTYCIKVQRLNSTGSGNVRWRLYLDPYTSSVTQAQTLQATTNSDYYGFSSSQLTYSNSVLEAENLSGSNAAFQWDELHMYTRYLQFVGVTSPAYGISPNPLYAGETAVLYGMQLLMRGNYQLGPYIYFSHTDGGSGYVEGNFGTQELYKTTSLQLSPSNTNASISSSIAIYNNGEAQASSVNDLWVTSGNYDGTLSTPGYYFITAVINSPLSDASGTITFTGVNQVFDESSTSSDIDNTVNTPGTTSTIVFGNVFDWIGPTSTAWNTLTNWKENGTAPAGTYPQASTDYVRIGVSAYTGSNQPQNNTGAAITIGKLEFGEYGSTSSSTAAAAILDLNGQKFTCNNGVQFDAFSTGTLKNSSSTTANFYIDGASNMASTSSLNFSSGTNAINFNNTGNTQGFTLISDASGSATIGAIPSNVTFSGSYTVQRYLTGGSSTARGYRMISSPVYATTITTVTPNFNAVNINYLQNSIILTGAAGGGFDITGNPTIYLYRESIPASSSSFTGGSYTAISSVSSAPAYTLTGQTGSFNIPVGSGIMFFYRGDRTDNKFNKTNANYAIPESLALSTTGTLNTGSITVKDWYNPSSVNLAYTSATANTSVRGFNLVGNPYPSSINWNTIFGASGSTLNTSTTSYIYTANLSPAIYIYDYATKNYAIWTSTSATGGVATGSTSPLSASNVIPAGQGFFVRATTTGAQLIINETAKISSQPTTSLLDAVNPASTVQLLRLQLAADSINKDETVILFNSNSSTSFSDNQDALYLAGGGIISLSSVTSDNYAVALKQMPLPKPSVTIPLKVLCSSDGLYQLNPTEVTNIPAFFDVWLMDAYKKDSLDLKHNPSYNFNVYHSDTTSFGYKRFTVVIRQNPAYAYKLLGFSGLKVLQGVQLKWVTENEENYTSFTLERSTDNGAAYVGLSTVQGSSAGTYTYLDKNPAIGQNLYRLKQVDFNGAITYSNVVNISYSDLSNSISNNLNVYPNPAVSMINLSVAQNVQIASASYDIKIINISGLLMKEAVTSQPYWQSSVADLNPGTYIIEVTNKTTQTPVGKTKFVKL